MTLESLHQIELSLMRQAFEIACGHIGLSTAEDSISSDHERLALIVQTFVERGFTDADAIGARAAEALANGVSLSNLEEPEQ